ncbi:hypothetical protein [Phaeodactylibacter xiamenensis]|uniref:DUF2281 domain-containing protein n=1 Tax=Phaeodactylibacter xiamenensis TaxID=1524460 RepID=A0A098S4F4_9BACT|nr:hypothetical protein [Phaeodactylibacter xiamenensis]KGE87020.1 hypothetical protein IX84_18540 [Phaeodactylibacter xiamenensis]MCR9050713.1 hypothetical protein [bacterium]
MELKLNIDYQELVELIKQLPANQIRKLKNELTLITEDHPIEDRMTDFQEFLMKGPVMDEDQFQVFLSNRKHFNAWRMK